MKSLLIGCRPRKIVTVFTHIHHHSQSQLPLIIETGRLLRTVFCRRQCRQQHRRQNGDDGNDHQQFNQREAARLLPFARFGLGSIYDTKNTTFWLKFYL